jgi:hypothetical protein
MADAVSTQVLMQKGRTFVVRLTNNSDGTGEAAVPKVVMLSNFCVDGKVPTYCAVDAITYSVWGMAQVKLEFDRAVPAVLALLNGASYIDAVKEGGIVDPAPRTGGTGNIILTTEGAVATGGYDITLWLRFKY